MKPATVEHQKREQRNTRLPIDAAVTHWDNATYQSRAVPLFLLFLPEAECEDGRHRGRSGAKLCCPWGPKKGHPMERLNAKVGGIGGEVEHNCVESLDP